MGAKEKAARKQLSDKLMESMGPELREKWRFPIDEKVKAALDAYDDAEEAGDAVALMAAHLACLRLLDDDE